MLISVKAGFCHGYYGLGLIISSAYNQLRSIVCRVSASGIRVQFLYVCYMLLLGLLLHQLRGPLVACSVRLLLSVRRCLSCEWVGSIWDSNFSAMVDTVLKAERMQIRAVRCTIPSGLRWILSLSESTIGITQA
jgi:hypothetical protein